MNTATEKQPEVPTKKGYTQINLLGDYMQNSIEFWDNNYDKKRHADQSPFTKDLHARILSIIPSDTQSILDAGCGGGALMAKMADEKKWELAGIDLSYNGVKYIKKYLKLDAQLGSILNMPLSDESFDLVVCSEVIEHLSNENILLAVSELYRVSRKYMLISTPYKENLGYHQIKCMNCKSTFHGAGHIQSVDKSFLKKILTNYTKNISFYFSGQRGFRSVHYADLYRSMNNNIVFIEGLKCPFCFNEIEKIALSLMSRIISYVYSRIQLSLKIAGFCLTPNNVICLAQK